MNQNQITGRENTDCRIRPLQNLRQRLWSRLAGAMVALSLITPARARTISLVLSNDPVLKHPGYLTTHGTADEVSGSVWRVKPDGSALTQLGPARYSGEFGPEHLNMVAVSQGVIYLADHGSSGPGISPSVMGIGINGGTAAELSLLSLDVFAGLTIAGQVGAIYQIDCNDSLAGTNWTTWTNLVLSASPYMLFDTSSPFSPSRFYRALKQ